MTRSQEQQHQNNNSDEKSIVQTGTKHAEHALGNKSSDGDIASIESSNGGGVDTEKGNGFREPFVKSEAEKKLVRKIAFTLMPFVCWILMLQVCIINSIALLFLL